jgi:hypothetical protein
MHKGRAYQMYNYVPTRVGSTISSTRRLTRDWAVSKIYCTVCDPYHGSYDLANPHGRSSMGLGKVGLPGWFLRKLIVAFPVSHFLGNHQD